MNEITVNQECSNGVWQAEVVYTDDLTYQTAMTSSDLISPVIWSNSHIYSVSSNTKKTFWVQTSTGIYHKNISFGFCAGLISVKPPVVNSAGIPLSQPFDCRASSFVILPIFLDVRNGLQAIVNPIYTIVANCKCDVIAVVITQSPSKGVLVSEKFSGNILESIDFEDMFYRVNSINETGKDIIKYILRTSCGDSPEGLIELTLI